MLIAQFAEIKAMHENLHTLIEKKNSSRAR